AIRALERDGIALVTLDVGTRTPIAWARTIAELVARTECLGGIAFCADPGLVCCVANKLAGVRAVAVAGPTQAERARRTLAANLLAIESPGRTFFEIRQMMRAIVGSPSVCPAELA